jgi:general stress protein 26
MKIAEQRNADMDKMAALIDSAGTAMLTTVADDGKMKSRPMMPLEMDGNGSLWFFTHRDAEDKQAGHDKLNLTFSDDKGGTFIALSGASMLLRDQARIDELWNPIMRTWFEGKDDPNLALLRVDIDGGEYWNSDSPRLVRFAAHVVSAVAGREIGVGENRTVENRAV